MSEENRKMMFDATSPDPRGIVGKTFGKLTVIQYKGHYRDTRGHFHYWYEVKCSCRAGTRFVTNYHELHSGNTTACPICKYGEPVLVGDKFGLLTVTKILPPDPSSKSNHRKCICKCDCGRDYVAELTRLKTGTTWRCDNPLHLRKQYSGKVKVGDMYGCLEVLRIIEDKRDSSGGRLALCKCHRINPITLQECGNMKEIETDNLISGNTTTCGCGYKLHQTKDILDLDHKYTAMIGRCYSPSNKAYKDYGNRGITVCDAWRNDKWEFIRWSLKAGYPSVGRSINRIDNDGPYSPENCEYTNSKKQNRNKRTSRMVTINGVTKCVAEWCEIIGLNPKWVMNQLRSRDDTEFLTKQYHSHSLVIDGEAKFFHELEREYQLPRNYCSSLMRRYHGNKDAIIDELKYWKQTRDMPH